MVGRFFRAIIIIFSPETLDSPPPAERAGKASFFSWLLQPEKLSAPAVSVPPRREPIWKWLLVPERLDPPEAKEAGGDGPSLLSYLISSENLPSDVPQSGKGERSSPRES
jgi:hypothetical protein